MKLIFVILILLPSLARSQENSLTSKEKQEGWKLLFDGTSTSGWHQYNGGQPGSAWQVADGTLYLDTSDKTKIAGDIITDGEFENYEFTIDWKIEPCGNSGIIFNVVETPTNKYPWLTGPEMQVLDNTCHSDAKIPKHRAGNLYDLIASAKETVNPAGEWNTAKIISNHGHLELWLNGTKQVETTMFDKAWEAMIKGSKFKDMPDFGKSRKGRIDLQDHGNKVWFRNIKIKELK